MSFDITEFVTNNAALVSALFGGAGVKFLDTFVSKRSVEFSEAAKIREELRLEVDTLRNESIAKRAETDGWRTKYWEQVEENLQLKSEIEGMKHDLEALRRQVQQIAAASGSSL